MIVLRLLAAVLAALATTCAVLGFAVTSSLQGSAAFVSQMDAALQEPAVNAEIQNVIRTEVLDAGDRLARSSGPLSGLAQSGAAALADQLTERVNTSEFEATWSQWAALLYDGFADIAAGAANPAVQVTDSDITLAVQPLVAPLLGDSLAGGLASTLDAIGRSSTVTVHTTAPLQQGLTTVGFLSQWRWAFAGAALLLAVAVLLLGRRRLAWLSGTAVLAALLTAGSGAGLLLMQRPPSDSKYPQLAAAVTEALTQPWANVLFAAAAILFATALLALIIAALVRGRAGAGTPRSA